MHDLRAIYEGYLACLNARDWRRLLAFVQGDVSHNGRPLGLSGYRAMLEDAAASMPDLRYPIAHLIVEGDWIAGHLAFDCHPVGTFLGLPVNGRRVRFAEHVFYCFQDGRIAEVRSVVDKAAVEAQLL